MLGAPLLVAALASALAAPPAIPGADPTGQNDSSIALNLYVRALCAAAAPLQEVALDLGFGVYRMDEALAINSSVSGCSGTLRIRSGTLLAGPPLGTRGNHSFLVTVLGYWTPGGVELQQLTLACANTSGGLRVDSAGHVHLSDAKVLNFATFGVWGSALLRGSGHDLVVERSLLAECTAGTFPQGCAHFT